MRSKLRKPSSPLRVAALNWLMAGWLMAAVLAGACRRTTEEEVSTQLASTPVTSEALRSWAESQSYVVRTEGISRGSGGGPCGHSPLCILVPVGQVLGAIFSERSELITVLDGETVMAQGAFKESGGLLHMRTRQDDHWREFQRLPLSTIHREPIVETASIDINADGSDGERTPLPILPQLAPENPLDDYDAYLERFSPNDDRSYWMQALIEALRYFPNEADSWVTAHIRGASRDRQAALLSRVCNSAPDTPEQHALESFAFDAYEALMFDGARVRPEITFNLHNCRTQRQRVLGRYARALCDGDEVLARRNPIHDDDVELEGCPQRRPLLALWFGREPSPARLREAFESDPFADAFYQHLRWERPLDRALLFERIDRAPFERRHLYPLLYGGVHPNDAELATLWRAMNRTSPLERIGTSLAWLISRADAPRRAALLATVAESPERCALASRALLGDTQSARHALNGLSEDAIDWDSVRAPTPGRHSRAYITGVQTCETLAAWALARRGCGVDELRTMLRNPSTTLTCFIP
ncbi:MAG: hypothetical protein AB8H86_24375 [Polyangiales bacterium]